MNYALRNTIILLITVIIFGGGGWFLIHWLHSDRMEDLQDQNAQLNQEVSGLRNTASNYEYAVREFAETRHKTESHPKSFFPTSSASDIYDYLTRLNQGLAFTELNFAYQDSTTHGEYGIVRTTINGTGNYGNLINFINRIETGRIINKVTSLQIQAVNELERLSYITFNFTLHTYYARQPNIPWAPIAGNNVIATLARNPFFPLIHAVRPVDEGEINIDNSRIIALSQNNAWLIDQSNNLRVLTIGDEVYLGALVSINTGDGTADFRLNRGGIIDSVTKYIRN